MTDRTLARLFVRRQIMAALGLSDETTPRELASLIKLVADDAKSMSDDSVAYGAYAANAVLDDRIYPLRDALALEYRRRMLKWFGHAIQQRATQGGGGVGLKNLKDGIAAYIEDLPTQIVKGYRPMSAYLKGKTISEAVDVAKLDAASGKIFRVIRDTATTKGNLRLARGGLLPIEWDRQGDIWFIPPTPETFEVKGELARAGFQWNPSRNRWETPVFNPKMKGLVDIPSSSTPPKASIEEVQEWFFREWLPDNIHRFETVFNQFVRSDETSYAFKFTQKGKSVDVDIKRDLKGPRDAVEELRYRYLGRQGRQPWLEVLDKYVELTKSTSPDKVMQIIDRMNNLQHSNGLFMEHFPTSVQSWYDKFLDRKYSARDAYTLAGFIYDSDLKEIIRWLDQSTHPTFRDKGQMGPDIPIEQKSLPPGTNWREKGYPREKGYKQPGRRSPDVQRDLGHLPEAWD